MRRRNPKKKKNVSAASMWDAMAFSPWLVLLYLLVLKFVATLGDIDQEIIKGFIEWFGTAYSLFLALVLVNVWAQFDTIDREFDLEIDALSTLYHAVHSVELPPKTDKKKKGKFDEIVKNIINNIKDYIQHVTENYYQEHLHSQVHRNGDIFLEKIDTSITSLVFSKVLPDAITSQFFESLNQAMDVRGDRIAHSKQSTRRVVLVVSTVASVVWLLSFFGLPISNPWVALVLVGGATFIIVMVMTIIWDLDKPFDGAWQVDLTDWDELLELIEPGLQILFIYNLRETISDDLKNLIEKKACKLRTLSRTGFWGLGWKEFLKRVARKSVEASKNVDCEVLFLEQFAPYAKHVEKNGITLEMPMVVLKQGDVFKVLLNSEEISDCSDLNKLEVMLTQRIKHDFQWY